MNLNLLLILFIVFRGLVVLQLDVVKKGSTDSQQMMIHQRPTLKTEFNYYFLHLFNMFNSQNLTTHTVQTSAH